MVGVCFRRGWGVLWLAVFVKGCSFVLFHTPCQLSVNNYYVFDLLLHFLFSGPMGIWSRSKRYPQEMQYRSKGRSEKHSKKIQWRSNGDPIEIQMES